MNFISLDRQTGRGVNGFNLSCLLVCVHDCLNIQQAQPLHCTGHAVHPIRVNQTAPEHLIAPAQAQHVPTAPDMSLHIMVPPLLPEKGHVAQRRFCTEQDDAIGIRRQRRSGWDKLEIDIIFLTQRIGIIKIGHARHHWRNNLEAFCTTSRCRRICGNGIFRWQPGDTCEPGHDPHARPARHLFNHVNPSLKQTDIATELVHQKTLDQGSIFRIIALKDTLGAAQCGNHAAAVNIPDQTDRHTGGTGKAHIGDVPVPEIYLSGTAGALHQNQVIGGRQPLKTFQNRGQQSAASGHVIRRLSRLAHFSMHNNLRHRVTLRLQQNGVEIRMRRQAGSTGLKRLRPADFPAIRTHGRIIRHVLWLERRDLYTPAPCQATQSGDQNGLANIRAGSL